MYKLLDSINDPADIRGLSVDDLRTLCSEVRDYMVRCCAVNPGHLASSLGAVEIIIGYHYVFDSPSDKIVFDVGHQAYAHKILTGRREAFRTSRCKDGISGFPRMEESPYDAFGVGHSSTSISAALGLEEAAKRLGTGSKVVALIGDGALTGGLAYEGLNNAGGLGSNLLVILNDNNQSIDRNLGGVHNHLLNLTTNPQYNRMKDRVWDTLGQSRTRNFLQRWIRSLKSWAVKRTGGDIFESLGFRYFGPIDGNDIAQVVAALKKIRDMKGPRVLHCFTVKGKGYAPAEADPTVWHAPGKFDPETGKRTPSAHPSSRYQDVFGEVLLQLARKDSRVVGITPAMASGCGMNLLAEKMPERFYDVGIEEEHAVTFSAGLAAGGIRPFCNIYSAFSQRAYDQIIHDVALQNLPVIFCFDRSGLVGEDGATHNGCFDLAAYRSIPNMTVSAPKDEIELKNLMFTALGCKSPFIIRYPRGMGEGTAWQDSEFSSLPVGKAEILREGGDIALIGIGPVVNRAVEAADALPGRVSVFNFRFLKPLDEEMLDRIAESCGRVITLEDGCLKGGLFGAVSEFMASRHPGIRVEGLGIPDRFVEHSKQSDQREGAGLTTEKILEKISTI